MELLGRAWELASWDGPRVTLRGLRLHDADTGAAVPFTGELELSARSPHAMWLAPWEAATDAAPAADVLALALNDGVVTTVRIVARAVIGRPELEAAGLWALLHPDHGVPIGAHLVGAETRVLHAEGDATVPAVLPRLPTGSALQSVDLSRTPVVDLSALRGAPLVRLVLRETAVRDLSPLSEVPTLRELTLPPQVDDLTPLGALRALVALDVSRRELGDARWLRGLVGLEVLDVADTNLAELDVIAGATKLRRLRADRCPITRLIPIALESLSIVGIRAITDVAPVASEALRELNLHGTGVASLEALARCSLVSLNLTHTAVGDLAPLAGHADLRKLSVFSTPVADLAPLSGIRPLQDLDLFCSQVVDLTPLRKANLARVDLRWTRIRDLTPLAHHHWTLRRLCVDAALLPQLRALDGALVTEIVVRDDHTPLDLAALAVLPQLATLQLDQAYGGLPKLAALLKLPKLTRLIAPGLSAEARAALTRARPGLTVV